MPQNEKNTPHRKSPADKVELTEDIIRAVVTQQRLQLENEASGIKLEESKIQSNERLAMKSMEFQARDMKARPGEFRKHLTLIAVIIFCFLLLFIGSVLYLLQIGKDEFAYNMMKAVSYVVVSVISYLAGQRARKKPSTNSIQDADFEDVHDD